MTPAAQEAHAVLILAAIRAEAFAGRLDAATFRGYVVALTEDLELPAPPKLTVIPGGESAA